MEITRQADYAVRTMVYLSGLPFGGRVSTAAISQIESIPRPFLSKVISRLATAGLVITTRGMGGGVALSRSPDEITLLQVIESVDGPIWLISCVRHPGACEQEPYCAVRDTWMEIQTRVLRDLNSVTMGELARLQAEHDAAAVHSQLREPSRLVLAHAVPYEKERALA